MSELNEGEKLATLRPGQIANGKRFIPNVPVITAHGATKMFYDDMVYGRTILLQFMSIANHQYYPVIENLVRLQDLLGRRLERDVFMYSITVDPIRDTPSEMAKFAKRHGATWPHLSGDYGALATLKHACFFHGSLSEPSPSSHSHRGESSLGDSLNSPPTPDCSMGLMRYGNDVTGLWGSVPTRTDPSLIVQKISWIQPRSHSSSAQNRLKRRGPFPVNTVSCKKNLE